jgi:uncharacterized RmlC-like cupin family protein
VAIELSRGRWRVGGSLACVGRVHTPGGQPKLPPGVEVYSFPADGVAIRRTCDGVAELDGFLPFIDTGQRARYFVGDAATSPERPSNATYKLGVVRPHTAFTPHAHGGEHFVMSLGYAACGLYDAGSDAAVRVTLTPGTLIRIPAMMPHSFANRAGTPLLILAANTGYGIDHEDYAITASAAEARGASADADFPALAKALRALEDPNDPGATTWRERIAGRLRRYASRLEAQR